MDAFCFSSLPSKLHFAERNDEDYDDHDNNENDLHALVYNLLRVESCEMCQTASVPLSVASPLGPEAMDCMDGPHRATFG